MNNITKIRRQLPENNLDAMLLTGPAARMYATRFSSSAGALLVTMKAAYFLIDARYFEAAKAAIKDARVVPMSRTANFTDQVAGLVLSHGVSSLGFEDGEMTYVTYSKIKKALGRSVKMIPSSKLINTLRNVKNRGELDGMIKAQRLAEKVFYEILPLISTKITEKDLASEIIYRTLKNGAEKESFSPIVVSGSNSSRPHGVPGAGKIQKGFLTVDFGVCLDGWCSDTTRTLCIGQPDEEMVKIYNTVLLAQKTGIAAVRAGVKASDVDKAARTVIEDAGYGEYFGHAFGHSLGLEIHESISASVLSKDILPAGAVISAEPGIYLPGRCGVRIEDVLIVTKTGNENITTLPKELMII